MDFSLQQHGFKVVVTKFKDVGKEILTLIKENSAITYVEMSEKINVATKTIERHIEKLKNDGKLVREGSTKYGCWKIVK
ncbi:MAG: winged helix-turn-helix transcriptional regulator [Prevotellaceae bacterium]|nr:winged helix-turn-helix transcriptional regulator [Prevotellaceae bacterium]